MKYFALLAIFVMQGCSSVPLKPFVQPAENSSLEQRQKTYEQYKVTLFTPKPNWFESLWLTRLSHRMAPIIQVQSLYVGANLAGTNYLRDYYEASGDTETAAMMEKAHTRTVLELPSLLLSAAFMAKGLNDVIFVKGQGDVLTNPWALGGIAMAAVGIGLAYESSVDYVIPGVESFDRFLRIKLDLSPSATISEPSKVQLSWSY